MTPWARRLRSRLAGIVHGLRPYRGSIDGVLDNTVVGWVLPRQPGTSTIKVGVFAPGGLVAQGVANLFRADLKRAGIGSGHHGFAIALPPGLSGTVSIRVLDNSSFRLGRVMVNGEGGTAGVANDPTRAHPTPQMAGQDTSLSRLLYGDCRQLAALLAAPIPEGPPPTLDRLPLMLGQRNLRDGGKLPPLMTAYGDYVRTRYKLDTDFDIATDHDAAEHFLNWYIAGYSVLRGGLRVPLTAAQIAHLNEPVVIGGQRGSLTRATWQFMLGVPPLYQSMDFGNPDWVNWVTYWWSVNQAHSMHVEDCLVPQAYADRLAAVRSDWEGKPLAPSEFLLRLHAETPALARLNLTTETGRRTLALAVLVMAATRPDYLRFLPPATIATLLDESAGESALSAFLRTEAGQAMPPVSRADYARALRQRGFDLDRLVFCGLTQTGDRIEAALLHGPQTDRPMVDVQIIGPFEKASGLGQATRLSAAALHATGLSVNAVDFDLDNPAPEGFSVVGELGGYVRARINLLHLNAESIPLAFAYQPDVFSGAYNIGYFFWELDTPAACHYLGMHLLDEIWVSTEYGVSIYLPEAPGPVTNVGMSVEDLPAGQEQVSREEARAFVAARLRLDPGIFVFLVVFDSFSFVQRKNPLGTLRAFAAAFPGEPDVRLVIKTQNRRKVADPVQQAIWAEVDGLIAADPRIVLIDETLSYADLLRLKAGSDCYVSLHKSEGWGFGMIEAMNLGVPVVATGYSGNMDFCSEETAWLVGATEIDLGPDDYIFVRPGQKWAEPDTADAARQMRAVRSDAATREGRARTARANVQQNFSTMAIAGRYRARLDAILAGCQAGDESSAVAIRTTGLAAG